MQAWWQQLQDNSSAAWLRARMQSLIAALDSNGSPATSAPLAARQVKAGFMIIPGPAPLQGQLVALQRALQGDAEADSIASACKAISADMTVNQVCKIAHSIPVLFSL